MAFSQPRGISSIHAIFGFFWASFIADLVFGFNLIIEFSGENPPILSAIALLFAGGILTTLLAMYRPVHHLIGFFIKRNTRQGIRPDRVTFVDGAYNSPHLARELDKIVGMFYLAITFYVAIIRPPIVGFEIVFPILYGLFVVKFISDISGRKIFSKDIA